MDLLRVEPIGLLSNLLHAEGNYKYSVDYSANLAKELHGPYSVPRRAFVGLGSSQWKGSRVEQERGKTG
jgi:hypothetical protein